MITQDQTQETGRWCIPAIYKASSSQKHKGWGGGHRRVAEVGWASECNVACETVGDGWAGNDQPLDTGNPQVLRKGCSQSWSTTLFYQAAMEKKLCSVGNIPITSSCDELILTRVSEHIPISQS